MKLPTIIGMKICKGEETKKKLREFASKYAFTKEQIDELSNLADDVFQFTGILGWLVERVDAKIVRGLLNEIKEIIFGKDE